MSTVGGLPRIGQVGIWSSAIRLNDIGEARECAAELEELGYGAIWIPGYGGDVWHRAEALLAATAGIVVCTSIVNIWDHPAKEVLDGHRRLETAHPGRFLLGIGVGHEPSVNRDQPGRYRQPLAEMRGYLDQLDGDLGVPRDERVLAALAPKMLDLARDRAAGSNPYLVPASHTRLARTALGTSLLAPEAGVVLDADVGRARAVARDYLTRYLSLPNYVNTWLRSGFSTDDVANGLSDRLVDALVGWGDAEGARGRVRDHLDAGADHVAVQVISETTQSFQRAAWRRLAEVLL